MTTATVAAVLTVLGYSIYDTIIIFDRIRENIPLMKRGSFKQITNVSLWETIPRSLATTFITLLPIVSLLVFGGATLKDFAFALLIGIASGAYSSIFVAAPLLDWIKEREPEWARRRGETGEVQSVGGAVADRGQRRRSPARPPTLLAPEPVAGARAADAGSGELVGPRPQACPALEPAARPRALAAHGVHCRHGRERQRRGTLARAAPARRPRLALADGSRRRRDRRGLARRVGVEPEKMRGAVRDTFASWRKEGERIGTMPSDASEKALRRLGLVRREEADDLALRLAQLEHRVRLLEKPPTE